MEPSMHILGFPIGEWGSGIAIVAFMLGCIVTLMKLFIHEELNKTTLAITVLAEQSTNQSRTLTDISDRLGKLETLPIRMVELERDVSAKLASMLPRAEFNSHLERHLETERRIHARIDNSHGRRGTEIEG